MFIFDQLIYLKFSTQRFILYFSWVDWHIRLQKLNQQAVLEASAMQEELTKETLISCGKVWKYKKRKF